LFDIANKTDSAQLPAQGSELVSKSTKVGILSRRADLQHPEGHGAKSKERDEALFAALVRGQSTIDPPRGPGGAEPLSNPNEKFLHLGLPMN
jgi:hypothetical protein